MAMIAMTTKSSMSVNAGRRRILTSGRKQPDTLIMTGRRSIVYRLVAGYPEVAAGLIGVSGKAGVVESRRATGVRHAA
jgi:hypothetical protein